GAGLPEPTVGQTVWRVHGGEAGPMGRSWTPIDPRTVPNYRAAAGLPKVNTGTRLSWGQLKDVTGIDVHPAYSLDGNPGGLAEYDLDPWTQLENIYTIEVDPPF